jgi:integrase
MEHAEERPIATLDEVATIVAAMPPRFKGLILLATWCQLRKGELCALRRRDIDPMRATLTVAQNLQQLRNGQLLIKETEICRRPSHGGDPLARTPQRHRAPRDLHRRIA